MSVAEVKMNAGGKWNIAGEIKMLKKGKVYEMPVKYAAQVVDAGYGEYVNKKEKPAPKENKAIEPEENKEAEPSKEEKAEPEEKAADSEEAEPAKEEPSEPEKKKAAPKKKTAKKKAASKSKK